MSIKPSSTKRPSGMPGFTLVWVGQIVSVLASTMSNFGLTIWAFQKTGSATVLGLIQLFFSVSFLAMSPFAGAMVDRYNRKLMMMISDLGAVLATVVILILNASGLLQIWHICLTAVIYGASNAFQWPAYNAAITTMLPKEKYDRANGMMFLIDSGPGVFAPIFAGALLPFIGLTGILLIDVLTFFLAIGSLLVVHVPQPQLTEEGQAGKGNLLAEAIYGFKYIIARRSLLSLLLVILLLNLVSGLSSSLLAPLILLRTGNNSTSLGAVESAFAIGAVLSGIVISLRGGFKKRINTMLVCFVLEALFGMILFGIARSLILWIPLALLISTTYPVVQSSSNSIWQSKVAPDIQGRVFSVRRLIASLTDPIMPVAAGVLADRVLEPVMNNPTSLANTFGWLVGKSPGSGISLQYVLAGILYLVIVIVAGLTPAIRNLETLLPDHEQMKTLTTITEPTG